MRRLIVLLMIWMLFFNGASRSFNGTTDLINLGSPAAFDDLATFTVVAWISATTGGESALGRILDKNSTSAGFWIFYLGNSGVLKCSISRATTNLSHDSNTGFWTANVWVPVAMTYDGSLTAVGCKIYSSYSEVTYALTDNGSGARGSDAAKDFIIGNRSTADRTFDGKIAYVQLFNRVLSVAEIQQASIRPQSVTSGLIGYWPLWGPASPEQDLSGNGNTGALTGTTESVLGPPTMLSTAGGV